MSIELKVKLDPESAERAQTLLGGLADRAENISEGLRNVGEALLQTTQDRFASQSDPQGRPWAPLALTTIMMRGSNGSGNILRVSNDLYNSINYQVSGNSLRIGANRAPYDTVHQFGSTHEIRAKNKPALKVPVIGNAGFGFIALKAVIVSIPARPYIGFGPKDEEAARDAIEDYLEMEALE